MSRSFEEHVESRNEIIDKNSPEASDDVARMVNRLQAYAAKFIDYGDETAVHKLVHETVAETIRLAVESEKPSEMAKIPLLVGDCRRLLGVAAPKVLEKKSKRRAVVAKMLAKNQAAQNKLAEDGVTTAELIDQRDLINEQLKERRKVAFHQVTKPMILEAEHRECLGEDIEQVANSLKVKDFLPSPEPDANGDEAVS